MAALADRRILGARGADGRVHAPPFEYDPETFAPPAELIQVGTEGTVLTWSWMPRPREGQPLAHPFAWALIRLDGADTSMLHAVDAGLGAGDADRDAGPGAVGGEHRRATSAISPASSRVPRGARRRPGAADTAATGHGGGRRANPVGDDDHAGTAALRAHGLGRGKPVPARAAGRPAARRALPGLRHGLHPAARSVPDGRGADYEAVELPDTGTVTTFCVVSVPFPGQRVAPPYVAAAILLDGADIAVPASGPGLRGERGADGHAGQGRLEAAGSVGADAGEHRPLPADRRARRTARVLCPAPVKDGSRERRRRHRLRPVALRPGG